MLKSNFKKLVGESLNEYNKTHMKNVHNRIDNIVSQSGEDNTEIVDARMDSTGTPHKTLSNRINQEFKFSKEHLKYVEGSYISEETLDGYLKDVEILGNTIQDPNNLADIRSVGDKVEGQELYEIPIVSCGKNLFNGKWERGYTLNLEPSSPLYGKTQVGENYSTTQDFIKVSPNETYYFTTTKGQRWIVFYDKYKKPISHIENWGTCVIPNHTAYIKFYDHNTRIDTFPNYSISTIDNVYEPYQEGKLTILSPVQLEKIGNVADRIIEKNGVWGVEKNIITVNLADAGIWAQNSSTNKLGFKYFSNKSILSNGVNYRKILCDKLTVNKGADQESINGYNQILAHSSFRYSEYLYIAVDVENLDKFNEWLEKNKPHIKYVTETEPQFIPLPHDQQVKLRTFTNKTNISFLCDVDGILVAQVPKSLGATVNTHTTQIDNLNKELDRIKKLEENTVSTAETESDFMVVEQTSNGYFEDIKLEGKTLVNNVIQKHYRKNIVVSGGAPNAIITGYGDYNARCIIIGRCKGGTKYTIIPKSDYYTREIDSSGRIIRENNYWRNDISTFTTQTSSEYLVISLRKDSNSTEFTSEKDMDMIILEGDHTQNQPSYFEGLKSVGDGVDEIVVSSRKGKVNLFNINDVINSKLVEFGTGNFITPSINVNDWYVSGYIPIENTLYTIGGLTNSVVSSDENNYWAIYDKLKRRIHSGVYKVKTGGSRFDVTNIKGAKYFAISVHKSDLDNFYLVESSGDKNEPHKSDKKRLLYYNEEAKTWKKPILRKWDSIEKHSDGKYYYHQRSGEVVLNGSRGWILNKSAMGNNLQFILPYSNVKTAKVICDKFIYLYNIEREESIWVFNNEKFVIHINKSRLETQDVAGFKKWLQANNVTVVYQLAEENVYECTNIDLITYANETNYIIESGAITPKSILKVHNNISNVVGLLQKKVSLLENKFIEGLKSVLAGDMYSLATLLYPDDFEKPKNEINDLL